MTVTTVVLIVLGVVCVLNWLGTRMLASQIGEMSIQISELEDRVEALEPKD